MKQESGCLKQIEINKFNLTKEKERMLTWLELGMKEGTS